MPVAAQTPAPAGSAARQCDGLPKGNANISSLKLFGYPIDDASLLLLMQNVVHAGPADRKALLDSGGSRDPKVREQVDAAVRSACVGELVRYASLRAAVETGFQWETADDARLEAFVNGPLLVAIGAEAARNALPDDVLAAALHGIPLDDPGLSVNPGNPPCTGADNAWAIRDAKEPLYPKAALKAGEIGSVKLNVVVDSSGFVRYVKVRQVDVDLDPAKGGGEMVYVSLVAAAAARFRPGKSTCTPAPGLAIVKVDFSYNGVAIGESI